MSIFSVILLALSLTLSYAQEEETPQKVYGKFYASHELPDLVAHGYLDKAGNVYVADYHGRIFVYNKDGVHQRTIQVAGMYPNNNAHVVPLNNGDLFILKLNDKKEYTLELLDSKGTSKKSSGNYKFNGAVRIRQLKDGNIAVPMDTALRIFSPDLTEVFKFETKNQLLGVHELEDGSLVTNDSWNLFFIDTQKKVTEVNYGHKEHPIMIELVTKSGNVMVSKHLEGMKLFDGKGKELASNNEAVCSDYSELPDGTILCTSKDGNLYFKDQQGKVTRTHFHDSRMPSKPYYLGKNTIAYANSSQLVFIDLQGKEVGVQEYNRKPWADVDFFPLGDNRFGIVQELHKKVHFFQH